MDSSWQGKCSSAWQSSMPPSVASSPQLQPQEPRNQAQNAGLYFYPHVMQESTSMAHEMIRESLVPKTSKLRSCNPGHADPANSFLSLLSGPPSLLQHDLQFSSPKSFIASSKVPVTNNSVSVSTAGSGVFSQNLSVENPRTGADLFPFVSSRYGDSFSLLDVLQAGNMNYQNLEPAKADNYHSNAGNEEVWDFSLSRHTSKSGKPRSTSSQASQKNPIEINSSISCCSSTTSSGCPRVFCLGASVCDVNPGAAVHVDSGETIAQWRKLYFLKFGIRVPEDHDGWDWPEGFSTAAGTLKHSVTASNMSKNSDLSNLAGSCGGLVGFRQPQDNVALRKNQDTGHKFVSEVSYDGKQRNARDSCNFLHKGLIGASQSNFPAVVNNQITEFPMSRCSTLSKFVGSRGPDNCCHSDSACVDSNSKSGQPFISYQNLQNSNSHVHDSDTSGLHSLKKGNSMDIDAVPSVIELKLRQPSPPNRILGTSVFPAFRSHLFDRHVDPQKSLFQAQLIHNRKSREIEDDHQYLQHVAPSSNSCVKRGQSRFNFVNHALGISNARDAAMIEQLKVDTDRRSVISMLLSQTKTPMDRRMHSKATGSVMDGCHFMPRTLDGEPHIAKCNPTSSPRNRGFATETPLNINRLGLQNHPGKGKEAGFAADSLLVATQPNFGSRTKHMEGSISCEGVSGAGGNRCSGVHDNSSHPFKFSGLPHDASDPRNPLNNPGKIPCLGLSGHLDHVFDRSMSSPVDSGLILPLQSTSLRFSASTSNSVSNGSPALTIKEGSVVNPYLLDENLRMLTFRHVVELSKQGHANASVESIQDTGRLNNFCREQKHVSIADLSSAKEHRHGIGITSKQVASEVAMQAVQSGFTRWTNGDAENLAPAAGTSLRGKCVEMQCQLSCNMHQSEGRPGRTENDTNPSNEWGKCCQRVPVVYVPGKCACTAHTNCLGENCNSKGETFFSASKEWTGSLNGMASTLLDPKFEGTSNFFKDKAVLPDQSGNLEGQAKKKVQCHSFQWRDVPNKATKTQNLACKHRSANLLYKGENVGDQVSEAAAAVERFNMSAQDAVSLKEQEKSNVSSGCSAAAVTQASVECNNLDSSTVVAGVKHKKSLVVDEGSGIDKCWSSEDPPDSDRSSEVFAFTPKINSANEGTSKPLPNQSSCSLIDELRLMDSLIMKDVRNKPSNGLSILETTNQTQKFDRGFESPKRERQTKWKMLDASFPHSAIDNDNRHFCSAKDMQMRLQPDQGSSHNCASSAGPSHKQGSGLTKTLSRKRELHGLSNDGGGKNDHIHFDVEDDCLEIPECSGRKRFRSGQTAPTIKKLRMQEPNCTDTGIHAKSNSAGFSITSSAKGAGVCEGKVRPVVCGMYGVISNGHSFGPPKLVSLRAVLESTRRYTDAENDQLQLTFAKKSKKRSTRGSSGCIDKFSNFEERDTEGHDDKVSSELVPDNYVKETETACFSGGKEGDVRYVLEEKRNDGSKQDRWISDSSFSTLLKRKYKEVRKRSLYELSTKGKDSSCVDASDIMTPKCLPQTKCRYLANFLNSAEDGRRHTGGICTAKSTEDYQWQSSISHLDAFCCVCGSSNKDETDYLLQCSRCLIRVHQACYGVSKVPRGRWYCRPCKTSSKNIACVLCGYGGGAMTRALRSRNIVKSLLKAWNIVTEVGPKDTISPEVLEDELSMLSSSTSGLEIVPFPVIRPVPIEPSSAVVWKMDLQKQLDSVKNSSCSSSNLNVHNSITAGVLDSTIKQWIHMVCGLWTPGTRCPNVDTMSAFDVSGASRPKADVVCSMCNRPGGSCIQCRVRDCSVQFHPWCAHQKGLLQSEAEGVDNESVGFYGRCVLHAVYNQCDPGGDPIGTETGHPRDREYSCARTEGYKGRKREGFRHKLPNQSNASGGCVVPHEQLNAWLHINRQRSSPKGLPKLPISDVEYDCRKEYARYKQSKGWKNLVVYKSGIHALGLYTSQFITRGAMVVEYVGEIVGLRVSDKREIEYQYGRKLQYKSACYFFRIDKEHIIDATRKGGIARFVNHSCLPNCVAKVISVRSGKKVVFFAERDIYPGEEITYDYHFNHEDEGEKILCFCNSKNCRRYLN